MTTATRAPFRPEVFADFDARSIRGLLAPLHRAWTDRRTYLRSLAELRALSIRQREDLGIAGLDLADIAHRATYRN